jgi:hypothetical protein
MVNPGFKTPRWEGLYVIKRRITNPIIIIDAMVISRMPKGLKALIRDIFTITAPFLYKTCGINNSNAVTYSTTISAFAPSRLEVGDFFGIALKHIIYIFNAIDKNPFFYNFLL